MREKDFMKNFSRRQNNGTRPAGKAGRVRFRRIAGALFLLALVPALAALAWGGAVGARIIAASGVSDPGAADAALVLGSAVRGCTPTPVFAARIQQAVNLWKAGRVKAVIFAGGLGTGDSCSEAEAARRYALARGLPAGALFREDLSRTTWENLKFSKVILASQGFGSVLIVSDPLHMMRAMDMARDLGLPARPSPTPLSPYRSLKKRLGFVAREAWFYTGYRLRSL